MWTQSTSVTDRQTDGQNYDNYKTVQRIASHGNKPVGDWISAPSSNVVAMATRIGPQHFVWFR